MKTKNLLLAACLLWGNHFYAQVTISPDEDNQVCPLTSVNFIIAIPSATFNPSNIAVSSYNSPIGVVITSGVSLTYPSGGVLVHFTGNFQDDQRQQALKITFDDAVSGIRQEKIFTYTRVRSLAKVYPGYSYISSVSPSSINRALCTTTDVNVSFTGVYFWAENAQGSLNSLTTHPDYEYLAPSGWSVNGTASNGSTWILGSTTTSAVITPDGATGSGGVIKIRPSNAGCGTGLATGPEAIIGIIRDNPTLYTTSTKVCDNSNPVFTVTGAPSGSSAIWNSSSNILILSGSGLSTSVGRNSLLNDNGNVQASVTIPCSATPIVINYPIHVGLFTPYFEVFAENGACPDELYEAIAVSNNGAGFYTYNWTINGNLDVWTGYKLRRFFEEYYTGWALNITSADCSTPSDYAYWDMGCGSPFFKMSQNQSSSVATVEATKGAKGFSKIRIFDKTGRLRSEHTYKAINRKVTLSVANLPADVYIIQAFDGKKWTALQFMKR
jgi:hypothetical protein